MTYANKSIPNLPDVNLEDGWATTNKNITQSANERIKNVIKGYVVTIFSAYINTPKNCLVAGLKVIVNLSVNVV